MSELDLALSTTPIADEYTWLSRAGMRCERKVFSFDADVYDPANVERVRAMWLFRMQAEHRSTSVFAALCTQLMEARATLDTKGVVLRMAQDELRHAELCAEVVRVAGGEPVAETAELAAPVAAHRGASPEERAMRNVIYGSCLTETVNCARFVDALDTIADPFLHDVTRALLSDEAHHAQFGFHYLTAWSAWLERHAEVRASISRYLRYAFAVLEREQSAREMAPRVLSVEERALGLPDPARLQEIFYTTIEGAVVPSLEKFGIEATRAWRERSFEP
ncbi:MAG TPA: ferritin-like domain-containing protein [Labilithrix sp.]|jgi:hypothetical protein